MVAPHIHDIAGLEVLGVVDVRIEGLGPRRAVGAGKRFSTLMAQAKRSGETVKDGADARMRARMHMKEGHGEMKGSMPGGKVNSPGKRLGYVRDSRISPAN